jgi:nicotinamidase-related amidase
LCLAHWFLSIFNATTSLAAGIPWSAAIAPAAARVLGAFRAGSEPVVHVQHSWDEPDAAYLKPGTPGFEHDDRVAPTEHELVVIKEAPNAFVGTDLEQRLRSYGIDQLVVAGMMTSMCVDATVRAAVDLGFAVTVVGDACAAPDLEYAVIVSRISCRTLGHEHQPDSLRISG